MFRWGGSTGQAEASVGISRAYDELTLNRRSLKKEKDFLLVDSKRVRRKKPESEKQEESSVL